MNTRIVSVDKWNPDEKILDEAAGILREGGLVAFPTETVYGLGANALDGEAVSGIFFAKGRPPDNPLIVHVWARHQVFEIAEVAPKAEVLMERFWPGPLTLVMPARDIVPKEVTAGLDTVAVRMPDHPVALGLIERAGIPVAAPSANRSGRPSPTSAQAVFDDLSSVIPLILDSGPTELGVESTVVTLGEEGLHILRPGGCPPEALKAVVKRVTFDGDIGSLKSSPGTRHRHYAPRVPLLLEPDETGKPHDIFTEGTGRLGYIGMNPPSFAPFRQIRFHSPAHFARGFFAALRELEKEVDLIVIEVPPAEGIGYALRDRIRRAAGIS
ncbi:MAG: L-threonylcarbamoyladenylate synthase [Thermovirgaceae bacterium]